MTFDRESGVYEALRKDLRKFTPLPRPSGTGNAVNLSAGGGGSVPTVFIAAVDSDERSQATASPYVADGTDDQGTWDEAVDTLPSSGGRVVVAEGTYQFSGGHSAPNKDLHYYGVGQPIINLASGANGIDVDGNAGAVHLTQNFENLTFTGGGSGSVGIRRFIDDNSTHLFTTYENLTFQNFTGSACIGSGTSSTGRQGTEGSIKILKCNFHTVEVLGGGSLNAAVIHDDDTGPFHTIWGCHFEDITHTQGGSACVKLEGGTYGVVLGSFFENAGTLRNNDSVSFAHNFIEGVWTEGDHVGVNNAVQQLLPWSKAGEIVTSIGAHRFYFPFDATIVDVRAAVGTAPTGASMIVDVHKNGTTIFTTQANRPTIAVGTNVSGLETPDVTAVTSGDYLTVDVDQVGSTVKGSDLSISLQWRTNV